jgi:hypothetical protein
MPNAEEIVVLYRKKKDLDYEIALLEYKRENERQTLGEAGVKAISNDLDSKRKEREFFENEAAKREVHLSRDERSRLEMLLAPIYKEHRERMIGIGRDKH